MNESEAEVHEFNTDLIGRMNEEQLFWFASAVVAMVMVDEHIDLHERSFLHSAIRLLQDNIKIQELEECILRWQIPSVESVAFNEKDRDHILESLLNIATIDRDFDKREEKLFKEIANLMGESDKKIENLIKIGHKRVEQFRANQIRAPNVRARL